MVGDGAARRRLFAVRRAVAGDYPGVQEVVGEGDALHQEGAPRLFRELIGGDTPLRDVGSFAPIIDNPDHLLLVAEVSGHIVGVLYAVLLAPSTPGSGRRMFVHTIAVSGPWRRAGIGRRLMEAAQAWAEEGGAAEAELNVWEFNRGAITFYEAMGYETTRRRMWRGLGSG